MDAGQVFAGGRISWGKAIAGAGPHRSVSPLNVIAGIYAKASVVVDVVLTDQK